MHGNWTKIDKSTVTLIVSSCRQCRYLLLQYVIPLHQHVHHISPAITSKLVPLTDSVRGTSADSPQKAPMADLNCFMPFSRVSFLLRRWSRSCIMADGSAARMRRSSGDMRPNLTEKMILLGKSPIRCRSMTCFVTQLTKNLSSSCKWSVTYSHSSYTSRQQSNSHALGRKVLPDRDPCFVARDRGRAGIAGRRFLATRRPPGSGRGHKVKKAM